MRLFLLWSVFVFVGLACGRAKDSGSEGDLAISLVFPAGVRNHPEKLREVLAESSVLDVRAEQNGQLIDEAAYPPQSWDRIALPRLDLRHGTFRITARVFHRTRADVPWFVGHTEVSAKDKGAGAVRILLRTWSTP